MLDSALSIAAALFLGANGLLALLLFLHVRKQQIALKDIPTCPQISLIKGNFVSDFPTHRRALQRRAWGTEYSPIYKERAGPFKYVVIISHPDFAKPVLTRADMRSPIVTDVGLRWTGLSIFTSHGKQWHRMRKTLTPAFHLDILKEYVPAYNDCIDDLLKKWEDATTSCPTLGDSRDVYYDMRNLTFDILGRCVFSKNFRCQTELLHPYLAATERLVVLASKLMVNAAFHLPGVFQLVHGREYGRLIDRIHTYSMDIVKKRRAKLEKQKQLLAKTSTTESEATQNTGSSVLTAAPQLGYVYDEDDDEIPFGKRRRFDFVDLLLQASHEDGKPLTDLEIRQEVDTFMFGGHDTSKVGLTYTLYHLASYPHIQEKCREEVLRVCGTGEVRHDHFNDLVYLTMCIKESLRMAPPGIAAAKRTEDDVPLPDGRIIPKGVDVFCCTQQMHFNKHVWEKPEIYDPSRFEPEKVAARSPFAFIPFSAGPRNCLGQYFAMNVIKTMLARALARFSFHIDVSREYRFVHDFVNHPDIDGLYLVVRPLHA